MFSGRAIVQGDEVEEFWALKDVSFEIKQGDRVGIIGRNGAGKSTLLKILSRITEPTAGRVKITGRVASLLEVGTGFHPELTGRENIYLNGAILGMSRREIQRKFDEIVTFASVEKFLDTPVKRYSSGMYVRLAFAVAAHLEPDILIVDEVLAVGDAEFQKKCVGKLKETGKEGQTVLFVSHNMTALKSLCRNGLILQSGALFFSGNVTDAVGCYLSKLGENHHAKEWLGISRPQNNIISIRKVFVSEKENIELDRIHTNTSFKINVEYETKPELARIGVTIVIYDAEGKCVLSTINNRDYNFSGEGLRAGLHKSSVTIPKNLLNNGQYIIDVIMYGSNYVDVIHIKDVIKLDILDSPEIRGDYFGSIDGCIRPDLPWDTAQIANK